MLAPYMHKGMVECGCDEAGRGCLSGSVVAGAVILPSDYKNKLLNDSKQLTHKQRNDLRKEIEREACAWAIAEVDNHTIDQINILNASFRAMNLAVAKLSVKPQMLLIDGNRFKNQTDCPHVCVVKGDSKYMSIAAASILAKTYRDELMETLHQEYPLYGWDQNKGYPTSKHRKSIMEHGISKYHRKSFNLGQQLSLF